MNTNNWNSNIIEILEGVRTNAVNLSEYHRRSYFYFKNLSNYFDIPIIIISSISASFSVGADPYLKQENISLISCISSMVITILGSIKLYLNISQNLENESNMSREFYVLSVEIFKMISLPTEQRNTNGIEFLNSKYSQYIKLYEESNLLEKQYKKDTLTKIDKNLIAEFSDAGSVSSNEPVEPDTPDFNPLNV
jgi:hypothetical protein